MKNISQKTKILICTFLIATQFNFGQEINNGSFESWEEVTHSDGQGNFVTYLKPTDWTVNQDFYFEKVLQDENHTEGDYSAKLIVYPNQSFGSCQSVLQQDVLLENPIAANKSLFFSIKSESLEPDNTTYFRFYCGFFSEGEFISSDEWVNIHEIQDFIEIEIPAPEGTDMLEIWLIGGSTFAGDDSCYGKSLTNIDNLRIAPSILGISEYDTLSQQITFFPNPVEDLLRINNKTGLTIDKLKVYSIHGSLVMDIDSPRTDIDLSLLNSGIYFAKTFVENHVFQKKIIKK